MTALHERLSDAQIKKFAAEGAARTEDWALEAALKVLPRTQNRIALGNVTA